MKNIWKLISNIGIKQPDDQNHNRTIILTNQINFALLCCMIMIMIVIVLGKIIKGNPLNFGTVRVIILIGLNIMNIALAYFGYTLWCKLSLIYLPHLIFILIPTLMGFVEEEGFTYYPYLLIGTAVIPQLLLDPQKEKLLYWSSLAYYFILVLTIDKIMILTSSGSYPIVDRINGFYHFYKIAQVGLFIFIISSIYYLQKLGIRYEFELKRNNKKLDFQNRELKRQKEEIERKKDELIAREIETWQKQIRIISHEIVNSAIPITNLAGMSRQMLEDESGALLSPAQLSDETANDIHHGLEIIESRTQALINFVKATKSISLIPRPNLRNVPVNEIFDRVSTLFAPKFKEKGVNLVRRIKPDDLSLKADLELTEQVLINLIQNSLEAMAGIGEQELILTAGMNEKGQPWIIITDNGPGIPDDAVQKIFLPFYSTKPKNYGIGLSLSRQIMLAHGGRLELNPESGQKGASFVLTFLEN